ncbi:hypothetical protein AMIS_19960 [Actinoplanes missouriensis 431]|uniref:Uncharacterized protein n=1 Tax=Actinoplanes missouriensis (strain ATCC 14538 / DSM 43046 / CBS 188.64 / JCM 3121 / NBRC 102363 / NCIMB 12654 / NRRL B-3342 / UNCC 431) TaxID=512565 RepID=I0H2H9_ACTM4|nr:hypothetical protein [Actinoplanes missouriensis]BAL87216.1 hypothetical protein AMIS_19960 [Actinoplanes missouriensis 431]
MTDEMQAVDLGEIVHVLRLARDGWPEGCEWETDAFAYSAFNGFFSGGEEVGLTDVGRAFLAKVGALYPERTV